MEYTPSDFKDVAPPPVHNELMPVILKMLNKNVNTNIIDIGCGRGGVVLRLLKEGYNAWGVEPADSAVQIAKKYNPERFFNLSIKEGYIIPIELKEKQFDTVISTEVIEHVYSPVEYVRFIKTMLGANNQGVLILTTPYHGYLKNLVIAITNKMDKHFEALNEGGHIKFWSKSVLIKLLNEQGFIVKEFKGVGRIPYLWKSMIIKAVLSK